MPTARHYCLSFASLAVLSCASVAYGGSHCASDEQSLWSCASGQKVYELCASQDLAQDKGYLQYRAGRIGKIEMSFPAKPVHPRGLFELRLYARNAGFVFHNGGYEYELFDALIGNSHLRIYRGDGKFVRDIACTDSNETFVSTDIINRFTALGLRGSP